MCGLSPLNVTTIVGDDEEDDTDVGISTTAGRSITAGISKTLFLSSTGDRGPSFSFA